MPLPSASPVGARVESWQEREAQQQEKAERERYQRELEHWVGIDDLGILDLDAWDEDRLPGLEWMVDRHFLKGSVALVSGDGGVGKSTLLQHLVTAAVMGCRWLDCWLEPGPALMLACEDDTIALLHRHRAICRDLKIPFRAPKGAGLQIWPRVGQDNTLMYYDRDTGRLEPTHLLERLRLRCRRHAVKYLVIDTATATFRASQNDENLVQDYITQWRSLAIALEGCVIITKHPSLSGRASGTGESGSVAWNNSVRSRFYLHRDKDKRLLWRGMKNNYGAPAEDLPLKWQHGVFVIDQPAMPERYWQT